MAAKAFGHLLAVEIVSYIVVDVYMFLHRNLYELNSCPDFIEDKGHYFGTDLPDADKRALIEYLKTM